MNAHSVFKCRSAKILRMLSGSIDDDVISVASTETSQHSTDCSQSSEDWLASLEFIRDTGSDSEALRSWSQVCGLFFVASECCSVISHLCPSNCCQKERLATSSSELVNKFVDVAGFR